MYNDGREDQPLGWDHYHGVRHLRNLVSLERICRREPEADIDLIGVIREFKLLVKHNPDDEWLAHDLKLARSLRDEMKVWDALLSCQV